MTVMLVMVCVIATIGEGLCSRSSW